MKIALIDPGFGEQSFNTFGESHWSSVIHHGLCSISAYAKSKGFLDFELIDMRKLRSWEHFREEIRIKKPAVVGITMRSCDFNMVMKAVDLIKDIGQNTFVVVGGVHPTVAPDEVAANEKIDHIIVGEGEISFVRLLQDIEASRSNGRVIVGLKPNLDELPFDDRELYDYHVTLNLVSYPGVMKPPMVTMIGSRGCPFNCTFCAPHAKTMFGGKIRFRSPDHVIEELKELRRKYNFRSIKFYDYSFTLNPEWVYEFCDKFQQNGFNNVDILAQSRADLICRHQGILKTMKGIGLKLMLVGFESGSQKVLDFIKKGTTVEENLEAAYLLKKHGIMVGGSFMLGTPHETKEDVIKTIDLVKRIRPHFTSVSFFTPCPGSALYDYCKEKNLSLVKNYDELWTYAPSTPKIKGIDYEFLGKAVEEIMGSRFGGKISGKLIKIIYLRTKRMLKFRHFLVYCYSRWVASGIYKMVQGHRQ